MPKDNKFISNRFRNSQLFQSPNILKSDYFYIDSQRIYLCVGTFITYQEETLKPLLSFWLI